VINGDATVEGSIENITSAKVAEIVGGAEEGFDTLKDIANWIASDKTSAAAMQKDITDIKNTLGMSGSSGSGTASGNNIIARVTELEKDVSAIEDGVTDSDNASSLAYRLSQAEGVIAALNAPERNGIIVEKTTHNGTVVTQTERSWTLPISENNRDGYITIAGTEFKIVDTSAFASSTSLESKITAISNEFAKYATVTSLNNFVTTSDLESQLNAFN
jgi:hypothetical protein